MMKRIIFTVFIASLLLTSCGRAAKSFVKAFNVIVDLAGFAADIPQTQEQTEQERYHEQLLRAMRGRSHAFTAFLISDLNPSQVDSVYHDFTPIKYFEEEGKGVKIIFAGKTKRYLDVCFDFEKEGNYNIRFEFLDIKDKFLFVKHADLENMPRKDKVYLKTSMYLEGDESVKLGHVKSVKVIITNLPN